MIGAGMSTLGSICDPVMPETGKPKPTTGEDWPDAPWERLPGEMGWELE